MVMTNPPFGKKSSITMIGDDGKAVAADITISRADF
jgi:type I restriction enzyme M protein